MNYSEPNDRGFTVYSKSGCIMCSKVKNTLNDKFIFFETIDCDEYLIEDKESFLSFIEHKIGKPYRQFPIVFYKGAFVGGYQETVEFLQAWLSEIENVFE